MKLAVLCKNGILEVTSKVLIETALQDCEFTSVEEADKVIVLNRYYRNYCKNGINIFREELGSDLPKWVLSIIKEEFPEHIISRGFDGLEYFADCFGRVDSGELISDVVMKCKDSGIDADEMTTTELSSVLKNMIRLNSSVDKYLEAKIHLYINHKKMNSYYVWLKYKFDKLNMHLKKKCGTRFFTESEIRSFYQSLAAKIQYIYRILDECRVEVLERDNPLIGGKEKIYLLDVSYINRALNEVILKTEVDDRVIVCCKSEDMALYSFWKNGAIQHNQITHKHKLERVVEYIEPLSN